MIYGNKIFGKPATHEDCTEVLEYLSGKTHQVVTGCTIVQGNKTVSFSVVTDVSFRELSFDEIGDYAMTSEPYDKAGGYGIQGKGALFIEKINGDYYNVVFPYTTLFRSMKYIRKSEKIPPHSILYFPKYILKIQTFHSVLRKFTAVWTVTLKTVFLTNTKMQ